MDNIISFSFSDDFIARLSDLIEEGFISKGADISRLAFVFGGKRPSLFLKRELAKRVKKGFLSPSFFSIDEFIEYTLFKKEAFARAADLDICFSIYSLARISAPDILKDRESFSRFLPWAREIAAFIEQLDLEDIEVKSLENIQFKASIGYDVPENINSLLKSIILLRDKFHSEQERHKVYSRGFEYLSASRMIRGADFEEFEKIFFCGLFYLHKTERGIIRDLHKRGKAVLVFQGDEREWPVLKKAGEDFGCEIRPKDRRAPGYRLTLHPAFDLHSQACLVREELKKTKDPDSTVIVLPQPDNIIPLLSEISSLAERLNVSMGYSLSRSALFSLFECIFKAQENKKGGAYYAKDYLKVLSHPLVKNLRLFDNASVTRLLVHKIEEIILGIEESSYSGSLFLKTEDIRGLRHLYDLTLATCKKMDIEVSYAELKEGVALLHGLLFIAWEGIRDFYDFSVNLEKLLDALIEKSPLGNYPVNLKMAERILAIKEEMRNSSFNREPFAAEDIFRIFLDGFRQGMISFSGSPLQGLQVLGLFETRSLNFRNVILMDVNESVLPNLKIYEPLLPREVMISLGLNRLEKEEEIQRYQFRRLISGADNVCLIYQKSDDKEKSRFIEELIWEKEKSGEPGAIVASPLATFRVKVLPKKIEVKKKPDVLEFLSAYEFSASSLNLYLHCPLSFYYKYVLGLEEKEGLLEEPEARIIGTFVHELLFDAFTRFIGRNPSIDASFKKEFFLLLDEKFNDEFSRKMKSDSFLIKGVLDFRMKRFLENEKARAVKKILALEETFKGKIRLNGLDIRLTAIIDRLDLLTDGSILILDYKTGGTDLLPETSLGKLNGLSLSRASIKNAIKSFQLPIYLYLIDNDERYAGSRVNACLYSIRDLEKGLGLSRLFKKEEDFMNKGQLMDFYLKALRWVVEEMLDPGVPFKADEEDARLCEYCHFSYLCR